MVVCTSCTRLDPRLPPAALNSEILLRLEGRGNHACYDSTHFVRSGAFDGQKELIAKHTVWRTALASNPHDDIPGSVARDMNAVFCDARKYIDETKETYACYENDLADLHFAGTDVYPTCP